MQKDIIEKLITEVERLKGEDLYLALRGQNARLLAVARAAEAVSSIQIGTYRFEEDWVYDVCPKMDELAEALAAVEDLL